MRYQQWVWLVTLAFINGAFLLMYQLNPSWWTATLMAGLNVLLLMKQESEL